MKKFEFSLQKMQRYKQQILDKEKALLAALQNKRDRIQNQITGLEAFLWNNRMSFKPGRRKA